MPNNTLHWFSEPTRSKKNVGEKSRKPILGYDTMKHLVKVHRTFIIIRSTCAEPNMSYSLKIWDKVHRTFIIIRSTCAEPNMSNSLILVYSKYVCWRGFATRVNNLFHHYSNHTTLFDMFAQRHVEPQIALVLRTNSKK